MDKKIQLKLLQVSATSVKVFVNEHYVDIGYIEPFIFDLSKYLKDGENDIRIIITNTLYNLMGPNWVSDNYSGIGVSPRSFIDHIYYMDQFDLKPFGIGNALVYESISD